jgi:DNA-binding transcriptional ArsR family regulator
LSEPNRLKILQALRESPLTVKQVLEATGLKQANASKQLATLHAAGILERSPEGTSVTYCIKDPMIFELCGLVCGKLARDAQKDAKAWKGH